MTKKYNFKVSNFILSKYIERKDTINILDLSSFNITSLVPLPRLNAEKIILPDTIKELKDYAFYKCSLLDSIIFGSGITTIGNSAFSLCTNLQYLELPDSVSEIGNFAFKGCSSLTSIILSKSIKKLIKGTFESCSSLEYIEIPDSVTELGYTYELSTTLHYGPFKSCSKLKKIKLSNNIQTLHDYTFSRMYIPRISNHSGISYQNRKCLF